MADTPEVIAAKNKALELDKNSRFGTAITPPTTPQESLDTVLGATTSQVKYSDSGSVGAILVMPGPDLPTGAAIKIEGTAPVKIAQKCSEVMNNFFQNATGSAPFAAPRVQVYDSQAFQNDPNLNTQVQNTLANIKNTPNGQRGGFQDTEKAFGKIATGESAVMVMEFAEGQQVNRLSTQEKAALVRSEAFAQNLGRAMAPSIALGLSDHLGVQETNGYKANISNMMYSPESGKLSVIDYSSDISEPSNGGSIMRVGEPNATLALERMRTFLEQATQSPEDFDRALTEMVDTSQKNSARLLVENPFKATMNTIVSPGFDSLFSKQEKAALEAMSLEEKKQFAANLLVGAIDGLEYMQKNQQALENAVTQTHEVDVNGQTVEHFYTQQEMSDMRQELNKLDAQSLKANMGRCLDARNQSLKNSLPEVNAKIKEASERMDAIEAKIDRVRNHPTATDRLKAIFSTRQNNPLAKLINEREKLKEDLRGLHAQKSEAQGKVDLVEFTEKMQAQAKLPPLPKIPSPGNDVTTTTTSLGTGVDQNAPQKPHVRDSLHPDHHTQSQGEGLGQKAGEKAPKVGTPGRHSLREDHPELVHSHDQSKGNSHGKHVQ